MTIKTTNTFDTSQYTHRVGVDNCPHCNFEQDFLKWEEQAFLVVLCKVHGKHGSFVIVNECPKCFEKSWVHCPFSLGDFDKWTIKVKNEIKAEHDKRKAAALKEWKQSLCITCKWLDPESLGNIERKTLITKTCNYKKGKYTGTLYGWGETECKYYKKKLK